jgi:IrrE N-terminal-like domain
MRKRRPKRLLVSAAARRVFQMAGTDTSIEDAVRIVAAKYTRDVNCPPTDLDAIARALNIHEIVPEDLAMSGELRRNGKGFKLVYSAYLSPGRKRFTIAHEIGHAIILGSGPRAPRTGQELERICDMIAVELLMPETVFVSAATTTEPSAQAVRELAAKFHTSLAATGIKYARLKGVSVFQVGQDERVMWASGVVKLGTLDYSLKEAISNITAKSGSSVVFYSHPLCTGEWKLSWESLGNQKLFVLNPT